MMNTINRTLPVFLVCALVATAAWARDTNGSLGLIVTPNNGVPVMVVPGSSFEAVLRHEANLSLVNNAGSWPLDTYWTPEPGGRARATCQTPETLAPGAYALRATYTPENNTASGLDINERSVHVLETFPEEYGIVHITDTHVGKTDSAAAHRERVLEVFERANQSEAAFALITGDLTQDGTEDQFRLFLECLDTCRMPTFVVPGNHDRLKRNHERFFGPLTYAFQFGADGFLAFDTKDFLIADEMGPQDGRLHYYRRLLRPSRWSIGFTHRYDLTMGMRAQMVLFVDDPLDYLVYGHYHRERTEKDGIPWGNTDIVMTPAAVDGYLRIIQVDAQGLHPGESIQTNPLNDDEAPDPPE